MNVKDIRQAVIDACAPSGAVAPSMTGAPLVALALIYIGDSIREAKP
jgi:hypothetical protein